MTNSMSVAYVHSMTVIEHSSWTCKGTKYRVYRIVYCKASDLCLMHSKDFWLLRWYYKLSYNGELRIHVILDMKISIKDA